MSKLACFLQQIQCVELDPQQDQEVFNAELVKIAVKAGSENAKHCFLLGEEFLKKPNPFICLLL